MTHYAFFISQSVIHVSTAFNNLDRQEIEEKIYPSPDIDPLKLIEFIDSLDMNVTNRFAKEYVVIHFFKIDNGNEIIF